jgi:IclR family acetate operon transcriptional repressor
VTHATVTGKLLLAFGPLPLDRLGPEPYERFTNRTLTTRAELAREVERVRTEGVAYGREEREPGLNAVGAPVLGREDSLEAMLSIQGPANRLPVRRMPGLASLLREAANAVGVALGGTP